MRKMMGKISVDEVDAIRVVHIMRVYDCEGIDG